jgi:hypothetical protein
VSHAQHSKNVDSSRKSSSPGNATPVIMSLVKQQSR